MTAIALLGSADLAAPFARQRGRTISAGAFLRDVHALSASLPGFSHVANLCQDRYSFAVGFAAALVRRQITLLPASAGAAEVAAMLADHPSAYCLSDATPAPPAEMFGRPVVGYPLVTAPPAPDISTLDMPTLEMPPLKMPALEMPAFDAAQIAAILFTSGSTGTPQPHPRSWGLLVRSAASAGRAMGIDTLRDGALIPDCALSGVTLIGTVPHQHSYGLESLVMLALRHGAVLHAERPFYPADIRAQIACTPRPRMLVTTPVHLRILLDDQAVVPTDDHAVAPRLDGVICATAPLARGLAAAAEALFAAPLSEIYGCTEVGQIAVRRTISGDAWRCLDGITLRHDRAGTWAEGIDIGSPVCLADRIALCGDGRFLLLGRGQDMVNIAGKRSSLSYLTTQLCAIEGVRDGVIVQGEESGRSVGRLAAFVVAPELTEAAILTALRRRIDPVFLPRTLHLVDRLPRTPLGKLTRDAVQGLLAEVAGS